jgi:DNA polymerase-3 subunit beta
MHIQANKATLSTVLKRVLPYVERKSTIPILTNLLIVAEGDRATVTATDLDVSLIVELGCKVMAPGSVAVPARKLSDTLAKLKTLDAAEVELRADEGHWVALNCGSLSVKLPGMNATNFPALRKWPADKPQADIRGDTLAGLIHRTQYAISDEESRYTLNGALLTFDAERVRMVATDGHQLSLAEHAGQWSVLRLLIPSAGIDRLSNLAASEGARSIVMTHDDSRVYARGDGWTFQGRLLSGQFPNWEMVMPKANGRRVTVSGKALAATVARVAAFADERSQATRWEMIGGQGLRVSAESTEEGKASEMLAVSCEDDVTVGLSAKYVMNVLSALAKDQDVTLAIKDAQGAVVWLPIETNGWKWEIVLMPLRM